MVNKYFPDEMIHENDLLFLCSMIERVVRKIKQKKSYVVNKIGNNELYYLISIANVLHSMNPLQVEDQWIEGYQLREGNIDATLCSQIPSSMDMAKVYCRLVVDTMQDDEDYVSGCMRVHNHEICDILDNYNASAYYEPSYVIARAYLNNGF